MSETIDKIILEKQKDGNWTAEGKKFGKDLKIREVSPEAALQRFLIHDGK